MNRSWVHLLFIFAITLALVACDDDYSYNYPYDGGGGGDGYGSPSPDPYKWTQAQLDKEVKSCVAGAIAGQPDNPDLETAAQKYCNCVFKIVSEKRWNYYCYKNYENYWLPEMERDGDFRPCL